MQNNVDNIISNSLIVNKTKLNKELIKNIIFEIKNTIYNNKDIILTANSIDIKNNNGYVIDFNVFDNIFKLLEKENIFYGDVILSEKDNEKKLIYGKQIFDIGNVIIINDGNTYLILELVLRNLMLGNTSIVCNSGYMYGTNQLIIQLIQNILECFSLSKYFVQLYINDEYELILNNYANIDLVICSGNHELQQKIISKCKNKILLNGYENFDIYIDDDIDLEFVDKINKLNLNINYYINSKLNITYSNSIYVNDIDEAIAQINYNGNKYASAIFTKDSLNASNFIQNVKSKIVTVNTSPTIERILDIKSDELYIEKIIIYPLNFTFNKN